MSKYAFIGKMSLKPGRRDEYIEICRKLGALYREEAGTEVYVLHIDANDPDTVWTYEMYDSEASFLSHRGRPEVQSYRELLKAMRSGDNIHFDVVPIFAKGLSVSGGGIDLLGE